MFQVRVPDSASGIPSGTTTIRPLSSPTWDENQLNSRYTWLPAGFWSSIDQLICKLSWLPDPVTLFYHDVTQLILCFFQGPYNILGFLLTFSTQLIISKMLRCCPQLFLWSSTDQKTFKLSWLTESKSADISHSADYLIPERGLDVTLSWPAPTMEI